MILLVSDTSILIDLERGGLLEAAFACGWTLVVPDLLYERELLPENGPYLRSIGLGVIESTPDELQVAQQIKRDRAGLSLPDCFALTCALRVNHQLLSGDKILRQEAKKRNCTVYGVLWLLDQMHDAQVPPTLLFDGLTKIQAHQRCRLPKDEIALRLKRWQAPPA